MRKSVVLLIGIERLAHASALDALVLLQKSAGILIQEEAFDEDESEESDSPDGADTRADTLKWKNKTLDEAGYQAAASQYSNVEMNSFIHAVLAAHGAKVKDKAALQELIPKYSGMYGVQSYKSLLEELANAQWIDVGETATPDKKGYAAVASWKSNAEMNEFIREVIHFHCGDVTDKDALHALVPHYSGVSGVQGYKSLLKTLERAPWVVQAECRKPNSTTNFLNPLKFSFDEAGYQAVAAQRSNVKMNSFIRRVILAHGGRITDKDKLHRFVPSYSGVAGVQSYETLITELSGASWIDAWDSATIVKTEKKDEESENGAEEDEGSADDAVIDPTATEMSNLKEEKVVQHKKKKQSGKQKHSQHQDDKPEEKKEGKGVLSWLR